MEIDFAICYYGLTRSTQRVYETHFSNVFNVLKNHGLTYKTFIHTWKTQDNKQQIRETVVHQEINYTEYALLNPDVYKLDSQEEFLSTINMDNYFYEDIYEASGNCISGEWIPSLVQNHVCALESQKRSLELAEAFMNDGTTFKHVMFIRPDVMIQNKLPVTNILANSDALSIPDYGHSEGLNEQFAITNWSLAALYGKRINELTEFRKQNGRIIPEKYVKYIVDKYSIPVNKIPFLCIIIRPL